METQLQQVTTVESFLSRLINFQLNLLCFFTNSYTDEEAHAELVYAEALLMISLMTFLGDQNLINLVKGAFRIRSCFQVIIVNTIKSLN